MYKFRKIIGKNDFPYHFKNIIVRYKKIGYNINVKRQTACLVVCPIKVNSSAYAYVFNSKTVGRGYSGGAMVLDELPFPERPTILITVGQGPIALAVGAGGGGLHIFTLIYLFSSFSLSLEDGPI